MIEFDGESFVGNVTEDYELDMGVRTTLTGARAHHWVDAACLLGRHVGKRVRITVEVVPNGTPEDAVAMVDDLPELSAYPLDEVIVGTRVCVKSEGDVYMAQRTKMCEGLTTVAAAKPWACWVREGGSR